MRAAERYITSSRPFELQPIRPQEPLILSLQSGAFYFSLKSPHLTSEQSGKFAVECLSRNSGYGDGASFRTSLLPSLRENPESGVVWFRCPSLSRSIAPPERSLVVGNLRRERGFLWHDCSPAGRGAFGWGRSIHRHGSAILKGWVVLPVGRFLLQFTRDARLMKQCGNLE